MNLGKRLLYQSFVHLMRAYQRLFIDVRVWGRENIPSGPKIYAANHISSNDPFHVMPVFTEPVHFVIGPGFDSPLVARFLNTFEQINVLRTHANSLVSESVHYLEQGESICIAPEGDIQEQFKLGRFFPGVAQIYLRARVPIIPMGIAAPKHTMREYPKRQTIIDGRVYRFIIVKRGPYFINVGKPWKPELKERSEPRQLVQIARTLKKQVGALIDEIRQSPSWPGESSAEQQ